MGDIDANAEMPRPVSEGGNEDAEGSVGSGSELSEAPMQRMPSGPERRRGVSAEPSRAQDAADCDDWEPPVYGKSEEDRSELVNLIRTSKDSKLQIMFGNISNDAFEKVVDAMFLKQLEQGENVITEGAEGDNFYIVKSGHFDILKNIKEKGNMKVFEASKGFSFGELALLYSGVKRGATVTATIPSEVWALERLCFRKLVVAAAETAFKERMEFLRRCEIFDTLDGEQIASLADALDEEEFDHDEAILEQGEKDDKMYILRTGKAVACIAGDEGEVEVKTYKTGDYFGEIALLLGEPRKASVYAEESATCYYISRATFKRLLGPLEALLQGNMEKYSKYKDAIMAAGAGGDAGDEGDDLPTNKSKSIKMGRKRDRTQHIVGDLKGDEKASTKDAAPQDEATSLKGKIQQDYTNNALVKPTPKFVIDDAKFHAFGGLRLGEKFTVDKAAEVRTAVTPVTDGREDDYHFTGTSKTKGSTNIAIQCQKGQKSADDPTPNQDNYFVVQVGSYQLYGVCDGHGPFGHLVSFRLVQSLPHLVINSKHFGVDWGACLRESFIEAQKELLTFCGVHEINVDASGAAGSVIVFDGASVHIAHIGDASVMLASWNRRDTRLIYGSKDHKPQDPEEKARLEAAGSEVRMVDEESARIYQKPGGTFPGLTMSRAFGDTACAGVLQEPEYRQFFMQESDEWYVIVASDGIWEFMEFDKVLELSAKKLRLKGPRETVKFLTEASRKRWAHVCGEYCDDITAILVQWNVQQKNLTTNFAVSMQRFE